MAQPSVGSDAIVTVGEQEPTMFVPFSEQSWNSGSEGENQIWDFSDLAVGESCDYIAVDPTESPYYDSFPNSDIYFVCTFADSQGGLSEQHTYYTIENDVLQLAGNVSISISNPSYDSIFTVFTNPLNWATFPYSYQDMTDDDFEARITSYIGAQTISAIQTGTSTHEVDGYGTLTTPSGTFENTIRVKRIEMAENSIPGIPFSTPQESYRYTWYAENENGVILNLDSMVVKDFNGNVVNTNLLGSYRIQGPTTTSSTEVDEPQVSVFPNPGIEEFTVELSNISDYTLLVHSKIGKKVSFSVPSRTINSCTIQLDKSLTTSGLYFVTLINKRTGNKITKKISIIP